MPNNPTWFDEEFYLKSKLNQLNTTDPAGGWTMETMRQAIKNAGFTPFSHFESYSLTERTSPNPFFNAFEYLQAKLQQLQKVDPGTYSNIDQVAKAIQDAGFGLWDHFQRFGWREGVNPSNSFDIDEYFVSKLEQLQRTDSDGGWTLGKMKAAFVDAGIDPVSHYLMYGKNEPGVNPAVVPEANRVPADPHPVDPPPEPEPTPTPEPTPDPGPDFMVTETDGAITFSGTATGDITFTLDGTVATFSRGGVTATTTADLETIAKITVGSGQTLSATAAQITGKTIDGTGNVSVTALHATGDANLSGLNTTLTVTANVAGDLNISANSNLSTVDTFNIADGLTTLVLSAAQADGKNLTGDGGVIITGSEGAQTIKVDTLFVNMISGGKGGDQITLGGGKDTVVVGPGSAAAAEKTTLNFSTTNDDYYTDGKLRVTINDHVIEADMVNGSAADSLAALVDAINATNGASGSIEGVLETTGAAAEGVITLVSATPGAAGFTAATAEVTNSGGGTTSAVINETPGSDAAVSDSTPTAYDTITNFTIDTDALCLCGSTPFNSNPIDPFVVTEGIVNIESGTLVDFDGTAAEKLDYILIQLASGAAGMTSAYFDGTDTYIFQSDGVVGLQDSDVLVKLAGVEVTNFIGVLPA